MDHQNTTSFGEDVGEARDSIDVELDPQPSATSTPTSSPHPAVVGTIPGLGKWPHQSLPLRHTASGVPPQEFRKNINTANPSVFDGPLRQPQRSTSMSGTPSTDTSSGGLVGPAAKLLTHPSDVGAEAKLPNPKVASSADSTSGFDEHRHAHFTTPLTPSGWRTGKEIHKLASPPPGSSLGIEGTRMTHTALDGVESPAVNIGNSLGVEGMRRSHVPFERGESTDGRISRDLMATTRLTPESSVPKSDLARRPSWLPPTVGPDHGLVQHSLTRERQSQGLPTGVKLPPLRLPDVESGPPQLPLGGAPLMSPEGHVNFPKPDKSSMAASQEPARTPPDNEPSQAGPRVGIDNVSVPPITDKVTTPMVGGEVAGIVGQERQSINNSKKDLEDNSGGDKVQDLKVKDTNPVVATTDSTEDPSKLLIKSTTEDHWMPEREPVYVPAAALAGDPWQETALWGVARECLVPIKLDVEMDGVRLVDSLVWDMHEQQLSPEAFAVMTCSDLGLPRSFESLVAASISDQLLAFEISLPAWVREGTIAPSKESLHPIHIDVRYRSLVYQDIIEWDINCMYSSPETFARRTAGDLSLPQEMESAIAFTIHEQITNYRQAILGAPGSKMVSNSIVEGGGKEQELEGDAHATGDSSTPYADSDKKRIGGVFDKGRVKRVRTMPPVSAGRGKPGYSCVRSASQSLRWGPCLRHIQPAEQYELNSDNWKKHRPASNLTPTTMRVTPHQLRPQDDYSRPGRRQLQPGLTSYHAGVHPIYTKAVVGTPGKAVYGHTHQS